MSVHHMLLLFSDRTQSRVGVRNAEQQRTKLLHRTRGSGVMEAVAFDNLIWPTLII
jgi:hypothetical protein